MDGQGSSALLLKEGLDEVALEEVALGEAMVAVGEVAKVPEVVEVALARAEVIALELSFVDGLMQSFTEVVGEGLMQSFTEVVGEEQDVLEGGWNEGLDAGERGQKLDALLRAGDAARCR
jgi:hypothetical protein